MSSSIPRVTPSQLRETIVSGSKKVVVVDVRDESERTHAVRGAIHAPAYALRADGPEGQAALDAVLSEAEARGASEVVVHCALSQVRGPACAAKLADRIKAKQGEAAQPSIEISILHGGFDAFHAEFGKDGDVTEATK